jgi:hypothetical protein
MSITVTREGGSPQILSPRAVFRQIPEETDLVPILAELGMGRRVSVTLTDGCEAELIITSAAAQPELGLEEAKPPSGWPIVARTPTIHAHCKVLFELDADVQVSASTPVEAERIIQDVFRGIRKPPADFRVIYTAEEISRLERRITQAFLEGNPTDLVATDVIVTGFVDPFGVMTHRQLEYQP